MKSRILTLLTAALLTLAATAQNALTGNTRATFDACIALRDAIASGSTTALRSANAAFKRCNTVDFRALRPVRGNAAIAFGSHFVWDEDFVDGLIRDHKVRSQAQQYAEQRAVRGAAGARGTFVGTKMLPAKGSAKFTFPARGHMELAVVPEPGAKVTLRVHDLKHDRWYNDDADVQKGRTSRIRVFDLPADATTLEIEIINCTKKKASAAIICNGN